MDVNWRSRCLRIQVSSADQTPLSLNGTLEAQFEYLSRKHPPKTQIAHVKAFGVARVGLDSQWLVGVLLAKKPVVS